MNLLSEKKTFPADRDGVEAILVYLRGVCAKFPKKEARDIVLGCEEILVNIASYAYPAGNGEVQVTWEDDVVSRKFQVSFEDSGVPFNPLQWKKPNVQVPLEEREVGGLGILILRNVADGIEYRYKDNLNILTIKKHY